MTDFHGNRSRSRGWLRVQDEYILVVDGSLRDREFDNTFREFQKWLIRLAKRVYIESLMVKIHDYYKTTVIQNNNNCYSNLFEAPSWSSKDGSAWYEYLLWQPLDDDRYPKLLAYKYYDDEENDKQVEVWLGRR